VFPPGNVCVESPWAPTTPLAQPSGTSGWAVINEAASAAVASGTTLGPQGTSFLLRILPYIEGDTVSKNWNWSAGVSCTTTNISPYAPNCNFNLAITDLKGFYCPTRRSSLRAGQDTQNMLSTLWTGGGTDYGGCAGRHYAFSTVSYNYIDPTVTVSGTSTVNANIFTPVLTQGTLSVAVGNSATNLAGVFGMTNQSTAFGQIRDGTSNTFLTSELQRITTGSHSPPVNSMDGWAIGGPCTLFTCGTMVVGNTSGFTSTSTGGLVLCNQFYGSPGSDHANGANMGMADGSVTFISSAMDANVFSLLGSMNDNEPVQLPQ